MRQALLAMMAVVALCVTACGADNVKACNDWKAAVACGSSTAADSINCESFSNTTCDISDYFNCLKDAYVCVDGQYDTNKLQNSSACASKATCN